jgi:hypothetical protein
MKMRRSSGIVALLSIASLELAAVAADFYVAPDGKDSNPGTAAAPLATLAEARDAVRRKVAAGLDHDIVVSVRGGVYPQTEPLVFGLEDSGSEKHSITYTAEPGGKVVLSGARTITGWKKGRGPIWTAELPEAKAGKWYFRQLFAGGRRAIRANTLNGNQWWNLRPQAGNTDANNAVITVGVDHPIQAWNNISDVEVVWMFNNDSTRKRLGAVNASNNTFTLPPPHNWLHGFPGEYNVAFPDKPNRCYFENAREFLDQPGEWYLDRATGQLSYYPRPGEDMPAATVVAPVLQNTMLSVQGTPRRRVQNLIFTGITVAYVDLPLPDAGSTGMFGCLQYREEPGGVKKFQWIPAAVSFTNAQGCKFIDGGVEHVGGIGISLLNGCAHVTIEGNAVRDLGGGGIAAGHLRNRDTYRWAAPMGLNDAKGLRIANNEISDCGIDYFGAIGVFAALMQDSVIAHNLVHDTAYTGIVLSGNEAPDSHAGNNTVEYNHIHHVMKVAVDGSAVYLSFPQAGWGALVRGNLMHDTGHGAAVYFDPVGRAHGCAGYRLEGNVFGHTGAPMFGSPEEPCFDNLITPTDGVITKELVEAMEAIAGLEPAYRRSLLGADGPPHRFHRLTAESRANDVWSAWQLHWPERGEGVVQVFRRAESKQPSEQLKLRDLDAGAKYEVRDLIAKTTSQHTGRELMEQGLPVTLPKPGQATTTSYTHSAKP